MLGEGDDEGDGEVSEARYMYLLLRYLNVRPEEYYRMDAELKVVYKSLLLAYLEDEGLIKPPTPEHLLPPEEDDIITQELKARRKE